MEQLVLAGAIICPASPSFYSKPDTIAGLINTVVDRIIDLAGFSNQSFRWMQND
jgi:4-hydroxy-3-polyprenylbenzoate decarboxylase